MSAIHLNPNATGAHAAPSGAPVPASLDLVERARLGINGLAGTVNPDLDYEPYFLAYFSARPAYMVHWSSMVSGVFPKYLEAFPLLRCMTGSDERRDIEQGMIQSALDNIAEDGLIYDRADPRRPWNVGVGYGKKSWNEDYSCLAGDGRLLCGMDFYHQLTGDDLWARHMRRTAERMLDLAIVKGDYAYYPNVGLGNDFSYPRQSGWTHTDEPKGPQDGVEGATTFYLAQPIRGLARWYQRSGDERAIDVCRRFARFIMQPRFWGGVADPDPAFGASRAHWWGHVHGNLAAFRGLLESALAAEDDAVKSFVRDGYEWALHQICVPLGLDSAMEGCAIGDLVALGIQLSESGVGDFWDAVDYAVRNALSATQLSSLDALRAIGEASPERPHDAPWGVANDWRYHTGLLRQPLPGQECTDHVLERSVGSFAFQAVDGRYQNPMSMQCCTANANQAWYYAWDAVTRRHGDAATVNLFFNRRAPWLDVESYLPYEGKVVIRNKAVRRVHVRVPGWMKRRQMRVFVDDREIEPEQAGAYLVVDELSPSAVITLTFPLERERRTLHVPITSFAGGRQFRGHPIVTALFKGSTCIGLEDGPEDIAGRQPAWTPLFRRPEYQADVAPMKAGDGPVVGRLIKWY